MTAAVIDEKNQREGVLAALAAYTVWGFFPLLFHMLEGVDPVLIVSHRVFWSLAVIAVILALSSRMAEIGAVLRDRATLVRLMLSTAFLGGNWLLYVWAVENGRVLETSLGYFLNPLVNVAFGMLLLGERQTRTQWLAIAIAAIAMGVQAVGMSDVPWVALGLAVSFAFYGYYRKTVKATSATGLFVETALLAPLGVAYIGWSLLTQGVGVHADPRLMFWLIATGPATALALLCFAYGVQRLRLTTIGVIQYISPSIAFILAIAVLGEDLNPTRLLSFVLIWVSLAIFTVDSVRRQRAASAAATPP